MKTKYTNLCLILIFIITLNSCNFPNNPPALNSENPANDQNILVQAPIDSTQTPTAFQPLSPTEKPQLPQPVSTQSPKTQDPFSIPTESISWGYYPPPSLASPISIPPPIGKFSQPENQFNILLLGSDQRPNDGGYRTDVMLLATVNKTSSSLNLTSFPRDLFIYIPGWTMERINTVLPKGGFDLLAMTFEYNFGVRPQYYALINFNGFVQLIDTLGGIYVNVGQTLTDHRDKHGQYTVYAGSNHMDGETALWYVRSRYSSSDFDRTRRQQEVLTGIFNRLLSLDTITKVPQLYQQFQASNDTNLTLDQIITLAPIAKDIQNSISNYAVGPQHTTPWVNPFNGAQVLLPNQHAVRLLMKEALNIE